MTGLAAVRRREPSAMVRRVNSRDLKCCARRKLTSIFTRTQQSPWAPKGFVMLVVESNPGLVTKPSQGLANLTLTRPERYPYHDFATLIKSRSRVKLAGFEVVTGPSASGNAVPEEWRVERRLTQLDLSRYEPHLADRALEQVPGQPWPYASHFRGAKHLVGEARRRGVVGLELPQGHSEGIAFEAKTLGCAGDLSRSSGRYEENHGTDAGDAFDGVHSFDHGSVFLLCGGSTLLLRLSAGSTVRP
jgi:hypothetical protein